MPASSPSSNDSPKPYRAGDPGQPNPPSEPPLDGGAGGSSGGSSGVASLPREWRRSAGLFGLTVVSVFFTAWFSSPATVPAVALRHAGQFTGALLSILLAHEFGHYIAARLHRVPASLPFFIPMPLLSPFGTMGAVIRMSGRIPTRKALLDIGASGPLAGLCVAIPMYLYGASHSRFVPLGGEGLTLGESILLKLLDGVAAGPAPEGMQLELSPIAFAAWAGLFVTMINLLPVGQLDGGHVAYSLLGTKQDRFARFVHRSLLVLFFVNLASFLVRDVRAGIGFVQFGNHVVSSMFWLVWFEVLAVLSSLSQAADDRPEGGLSNATRLFATFGLALLGGYGADHDASPFFWLAWFVGLGMLLAMERRGGSLRPSAMFDHPPTGAAPLDGVRAVIGVVTLAFFVLLFMPTPMVM